MDARGQGIVGAVDNAGRLLGEGFGFGVGQIKLHDRDMGSKSAVAKFPRTSRR